MEAQHQGTRIPGAIALPQMTRPDPPRGAELGDLLEEVDVRVEEEGETWREGVDVEAPLDAGIDVGEAVGEGERELLHSCRAGLANVIAGDGDRVPARNLAGAVLDRVDHQPHGWLGRKDVLLLGDVLLQDVVLESSRDV